MSNILIIDIETTDFQARNGKIVEVGIVDLNLNTGERKIIFDKVCHERPITREHVEKSWIVNNSDLNVTDIQRSPQLIHIQAEIQEIINNYPLGATAFNNAFDFGFLESRGFIFPKKLGCPMKLSTDLCRLPKKTGYGWKWPSVEEAHRYFFGEVGYIEKHRGADDAYFEAEIVYELYKRGVFKI